MVERMTRQWLRTLPLIEIIIVFSLRPKWVSYALFLRPKTVQIPNTLWRNTTHTFLALAHSTRTPTRQPRSRNEVAAGIEYLRKSPRSRNRCQRLDYYGLFAPIGSKCSIGKRENKTPPEKLCYNPKYSKFSRGVNRL